MGVARPSAAEERWMRVVTCRATRRAGRAGGWPKRVDVSGQISVLADAAPLAATLRSSDRGRSSGSRPDGTALAEGDLD